MRYCPHCQRLNPGRPRICHYCGRTWDVRLCPRNHENPPDAQRCGTCGSMDLSEPAGPKPVWTYFLKALIVIIIWIDVYFLFKIFFLIIKINGDILLKFTLLIALLVAADQIAVSVLPPPFRGMFTRINQFLLRSVKRLMAGLVYVVKEIINLILNW